MADVLDLKEQLPIIPIRDGVVFPGTEVVLTFGRQRSVAAIEAANSYNRHVVLVMQKTPNNNNPKPTDLFEIGTKAVIERMFKNEGEINALVRGISRVRIDAYGNTEPYFLGNVSEIPDILENEDQVKALSNHLLTELRKAVNIGKSIDFLIFMNIMSSPPAGDLANQVANILEIKPYDKQGLLEMSKVQERLERVNTLLSNEVKVLELERKISSKTQERFDKNIRESVLRERLKTIEQELGQEEDKEFAQLAKKISEAKMPVDVEEKASKELKRLSQMSSYNPEASYLRTYLDWLIELPWSKASKTAVDIAAAEKILDTDHYGLKKVKERILEYLAVMKLKTDKAEIANEKAEKETDKKTETESATKRASLPTILCFVGPPGVGKTSLGKSIAKALGRKFVKISLGGVRDEAEIRGHRRTYVGALPGRIIQAIKQAETNNPVFMMDEVDKIGADFRGDPSAALLEALDPEQNHAFSDHYLEVSFDLSHVFFITTCNVLDTIPPALRDRLEIIHFPGYTEDEKFHIARGFITNKQMENNGLANEQARLTDDAIKNIIRRYTREAGVRSLEREISAVFRKIAKKVVEGKKDRFVVAAKDLQKYLGPAKFTSSLIEKKDETGMSTGLAWTEAGGDILFIEVALVPGKGQLILTGHLGEVMKESCQAALSYVRSHWQVFSLPEKFFQKIDVHVHVPEGAVPKDGPSAGTAITTALVSALTRIPVKRFVGMTGEVTLRGRVLEIGGVKEKVIAAHRARLKTIILPKNNKKDLEDIPKYVLDDLEFIFVDDVGEVLKIALARPLPQIKPLRTLRPVTPPLQA
ncbi:TPA: endopeptidase La [Patescibacteria group bacterium]|uniref:Lon protease n=1 Tax=Candidatus Gottesmanbacteria bacterium GW2011_GWA1_43_11 TaxID=1618436 RepID=A0A0G1CFB8_9BACT|nr:MAG: Lon protease [Candidatus Gottesmanbacteria bacterium GW2011_GWA1_43_11]HCS78368.1 endopeptidase La [Patescibacteria group bacterium]